MLAPARFLYSILLLPMICGCGQPPAQKSADKPLSQPVAIAQAEDIVPSKRLVGLIGQGIVDVLMSAKKVEVFRINGESTDDDSIEGWKITAKGADRDAAFATNIRKCSTKRTIYD